MVDVSDPLVSGAPDGAAPGPPARRLAQTFGRTLAEVIRARQLVEACLEAWDIAEDDRSALVLVVDELVTNAVRHGRGSVELYVDASDTLVRIEVCDQGGGQPRLRTAERSRSWLGGRGLRLVDGLVDGWGTTVRPGRTVVWAQHAIGAGSAGSAGSVCSVDPVALRGQTDPSAS